MLAACESPRDVYFLEPLFDDRDGLVKGTLEGVWADEEEASVLSIEESEAKTYRIDWRQGGDWNRYRARLGQLGGEFYFDLWPDPAANSNAATEGERLLHSIYRVQLDSEGLRLLPLNLNHLEQQIRAGTLLLPYEPSEGDLVFTAPTSDLQTLIIQNSSQEGFFDGALLQTRQAEDVAHFFRGEIHFAAGHFDLAVASYEAALDLSPDYTQALTRLGDAHRALTRWDDAARAYEEALRLQPGDPDLYARLVLTARRRGRDDEADRWSREVFALTPEDASELDHLAEAFTKKNLFEEALRAWEHAAALEPDNSEYRIGVIGAHLWLGHYREARRELDYGHWSGSDQQVADCVEAMSYFLEADANQAERQFDACFPPGETPEPFLLLLRHLARRHLSGGDGSARQLLEDALAGREENDWNGTLFLYHLDQVSDADLLALAPNPTARAQAHFYIGYRCYLNRDLERARHHWEKSLAPLARDDLDDFEEVVQPEHFLARARLRQIEP
jgi:tetratricopeptide (TPR) repeat protein